MAHLNQVVITYFTLRSVGGLLELRSQRREKKDDWDQAQKQYSEKAAKNYYSEFVSGLLKGKTIEYNPEVFPLFSKKLSSIYLIEKEKKKL